MGDEHDDMVWRAAAVPRVIEARRQALSEQPTETVPLDALADRVLATSITADRDLPAHDIATMDGYAFDATDQYPLAVVDGAVFPEDDPPAIGPGDAVEIATGAPLPARANAVLKREEAEVSDGSLSGPAIEPGTYRYAQGSNVAAGERLFDRWESLGPKDAILLGDLGRESVPVVEPFSVGVLATGTEIHRGDRRDLDSNMLAGLVRSWGHEATYEGTAPDEYDRVRDRLVDLAERYDVVLTTGGTSVGEKDYVVRAMADIGVVEFHRVRLRPGKPIAFARLGNAVGFAIPGKPVGAHTIATLVVRPFFTGRTALPTVEATLQRTVELGPAGFEYAVPVTLADDEAMPMGHVDSSLAVYDRQFDPSVLSSSTKATRADGFVVTESTLDRGTTVDVVPYPVVE
jgi:molybdopterin molybdotransferase